MNPMGNVHLPRSQEIRALRHTPFSCLWFHSTLPEGELGEGKKISGSLRFSSSHVSSASMCLDHRKYRTVVSVTVKLETLCLSGRTMSFHLQSPSIQQALNKWWMYHLSADKVTHKLKHGLCVLEDAHSESSGGKRGVGGLLIISIIHTTSNFLLINQIISECLQWGRYYAEPSYHVIGC